MSMFSSDILNQVYGNDVSWLVNTVDSINFDNSNDNNDKESNEICCECDNETSKCIYINKLASLMTAYKTISDSVIEDTNNVDTCLSYYLHLISTHDDDFEYIYEALGGVCHIEKCNRFQRNYRTRNSMPHQLYKSKITQQ
eukprot:379442_1